MNVCITRVCFLSRTCSKLRLCPANHRAGYFSNLVCDWLSIVWAYFKQETENGPRPQWVICGLMWYISLGFWLKTSTIIRCSIQYEHPYNWRCHGNAISKDSFSNVQSGLLNMNGSMSHIFIYRVLITGKMQYLIWIQVWDLNQHKRCKVINTLRPRQNGRHFPDNIFKCIFLNENM